MAFQNNVKIFLLLYLLCYNSLYAQTCTNHYASIIHKSISYDTITCSVKSNANELLCAGNTLSDHGFIKKFSAKGTPLFSYQYNPVYNFDRTYFMNLQFTSIVATKDGSFVLAGNVTQDKYVYSAEYVNNLGVLMKIDKYGMVSWCKKFESTNGIYNNGFDLAMSDVIELSNGDLVGYLGSDYGSNYPSFGKIICFSKNGVKKWSTLLSTQNFDGGEPGLATKRQLIQTKNGHIVVADFVYKRPSPGTNSNAPEALLHIVSMNAPTGTLNWEKSYEYPSTNPESFPDIVSTTELENGNLIFNTSIYSAIGSDKKGLRIETNAVGDIKRATSYVVDENTTTQLVDVINFPATSYQVYLFKNNDHAILANVNDTGKIVSIKGFNNSGGLFPVNSFLDLGAGYGIFMSNFKSRETRLLITDTAGKIDCINVSTTLKAETTFLQQRSLLTSIFQLDPNPFVQSDFAISIANAPLQKSTECESSVTCCTDVTDNTNIPTITICEGKSYTLPDNNIVRSGGLYFVVNKTNAGCDSIRFVKVIVDKKPSFLQLGSDVCLGFNESVKLTATGGYTNYNWTNSSSEDSFFTARSPGLYWVEVTNSCGFKRDSVEVFAECDFDIFMPTAFTPNNDGLNDNFGVSLYNKNRFRRLRIFNRLGQKVFETSDINERWNGKYKGLPQPMDSYVYYLEMENLNGRHVMKRSMFTLIR